MGVYSESAANVLRISEMEKVFHFSDLLEFAVDCEKNNQNMFNALIELDFREAVDNISGTVVTEANAEAKENSKVKAIIDKIVDALKKFGDLIATTANKIRLKFLELSGANKKLVEKIGDIDAAAVNRIVAANTDKYEEVKLTRAKNKKAVLDSINEALETTDEEKKKIIEKIDNAENPAEEADKIIEDISGWKFNEQLMFGEKMEDLFESVSISDYLNKEDLKALKADILSGYKANVDVFTSGIKKSIAANNKTIADCKAIFKNTKSEKAIDRYNEKNKEIRVKDSEGNKTTVQAGSYYAYNNLLAPLANASYRVLNRLNAFYVKALNTAINFVVKEATVARSAYVILGKIQKQAVKESTTFAEDIYMIESANESYMEKLFA